MNIGAHGYGSGAYCDDAANDQGGGILNMHDRSTSQKNWSTFHPINFRF